MKFLPGKTYKTCSICDHECIISVTVKSRTAKTIKTTDGKVSRCGIHNGIEFVRPWGNYSMAPIIRAE